MKPPTAIALMRFCHQWHKAQQSKNVGRMEALLKPKWLNYWWWARRVATGQQWIQNCASAIETILERMGLVAPAPRRKRLSELIMEEAEKLKNEKGSKHES